MPPSKFTIREFQKDDAEQLWQIDQKCFEPGISYTRAELAWYIGRKNGFTLVAESKHLEVQPHLVGFIVADHNGRGSGHIITIDVLPEARRQHLGSTLLAASEERLRAAGCRAVTLETAVDNTAAIGFYQRHQYAILRTIPHYYQNGVDALLMIKKL